MKIKTLTVSELNNYIAKILNSNPLLHNFFVSGEVFNLKETTYGYTFFSIKDETSKVNCILFTEDKINLYEGNHIVVEGKINIYEKNGTYSIVAKKITSLGMGQAYLEFEKIKQKLEDKGYFDLKNKKEIPNFPLNIGIITSTSGAAIQDILKLLEKRFPLTEVNIFNSKMQGIDAKRQVIMGIEKFSSMVEIDLIILTRGGGSYDELSIFNDENIAEAIFNSIKPIISAIGHETDFFISDFVADARASTPSACIENYFPDIQVFINNLLNSRSHLENLISNKIDKSHIELANTLNKLNNKNIYFKLLEKKAILASYKDKLLDKIEKILTKNKSDLINYSTLLNSLNPLNIIEKGYVVMTNDKGLISSISHVNIDDEVNITLKDGYIKVKILNKKGRD